MYGYSTNNVKSAENATLVKHVYREYIYFRHY
jgi:hypothetical protein